MKILDKRNLLIVILVILALLVSLFLVRAQSNSPFATRVSINCGSTFYPASAPTVPHGSLQSAQSWGDSTLAGSVNMIFLYEYSAVLGRYDLKWVKYDSECGGQSRQWIQVGV